MIDFLVAEEGFYFLLTPILYQTLRIIQASRLLASVSNVTNLLYHMLLGGVLQDIFYFVGRRGTY